MGLSGNAIVEVLLRERVRISASVLPILRDVHAGDDVFQQVVLQALEGREQFREPEHLLAWSLRAARHPTPVMGPSTFSPGPTRSR